MNDSDLDEFDILLNMVDVTAKAVRRNNSDIDIGVNLTRHFIGQTMQGMKPKDQFEYAELIHELITNTLRSMYKRGAV